MTINKKFFSLCMGLSLGLAVTARASRAETLPITTTNVDIMGCGLKDAQENLAVVVLRAPIENGIFEEWLTKGKLYVFLGEKGPNYKGVTGHQIVSEGTTELPVYPGEEWTFASPRDTFFTGRGNFNGLFLTRSENTKELSSGLFVRRESRTENLLFPLTCTNDQIVIREWVKQVKSFMP